MKGEDLITYLKSIKDEVTPFDKYVSDKFIRAQYKALAHLYATSQPIGIDFKEGTWELIYEVSVELTARDLKDVLAKYVNEHYSELLKGKN